LAHITSFCLQIVGAFWYLLAIERQDDCWRDVCKKTSGCDVSYLYCGNSYSDGYDNWKKISKKTLEGQCLADGDSPFKFGIYAQALTSGVVASNAFFAKLCYCMWFGLQNLR